MVRARRRRHIVMRGDCKRRRRPKHSSFFVASDCGKYLKGLLIASGKDLIKIHDLIRLANLLKKDFPGICELVDDLMLLNKYCIDARYPRERRRDLAGKKPKTRLKLPKASKNLF